MEQEPEIVARIIREVGCDTLGNWDGCCCSSFSIRNVDVEIRCGKGGDEHAVYVHSVSMDYDDKELLRLIAAEVAKQVDEKSGRAGPVAQYLNGKAG